MKRIIIVDDHPMMRKGLTSTLGSDPGFEVVAQLGQAEELFELLPSTKPDLVLADVSLPGMSGIELVKNLVFQYPEIKVLVVSRHDETLYAERALRAGAKGYIMKFEPSEILLEAVKRVLNGGIYISERMNERILMGMLHGKRDPEEPSVSMLSDRELEVFELIGQGRSSAEIAGQLHLAPKTVETYRSRIKEKLGLNNASEMMFHAIKWVDEARSDSGL